MIDEDFVKIIGKDNFKRPTSDQMRQVAQIMKQRAQAPQQAMEDSECEEEVEPSIDSELKEFDI